VVASNETSDSPGLEFCILGPLSIRDGERVLALGSRKQRTLLASLLLHPNERVSLDHLANELWGERPPATAVHTLHVHVSALRKTLGDAERRTLIVTRPDGYELSLEPEQLDSSRFVALAARGRAALASGDAAAASAALTEALALWRGRPLADVELEGLDRIEVERLAELRITALEERIDADLALGHHAQLVGEIEALVAEYPLRERLRAQLMTALARSGRHAEALAAFQDARRTLVDELGLEPSPALRELESAILRHDPSLTASLPTREPIAAAILPRGRKRRSALALAVLTALALIAGIAAAFLVGGGDGTSTSAAPQSPASTKARPPVTITVSSRPQAHAEATKHGHAPSHPRPAPSKHVVARPVPDPTTSTTTSRPVHHVTTVTPKPKPSRTNVTTTQPAPAVMSISDDFEDGVRNVSTWHVVVAGTNVDVVEQNGSLEIGIGAGATPGGAYNVIEGHYGTMCTFPGDFDARVDYRLLSWPAQSGVYLALNAFFVNAFVERWSQSAEEAGVDPLEVYGSFIQPRFSVVNTNDQQGSLRLRRKDRVITSYFLSAGQWRMIDSARRTGGAVMGIQLAANQGVSVQKTVRVAFDNFSVSATRAICP
jgi:DNA-binding SARP family transcriptional activator